MKVVAIELLRSLEHETMKYWIKLAIKDINEAEIYLNSDSPILANLAISSAWHKIDHVTKYHNIYGPGVREIG